MEKTVSIGSKLRELLKHGIVYGITSSLQNILNFLLLPLLTSYYSPSKFGVYSIIVLAGTLASAIFFLGASTALGRFYYDEDSIEYRRQITTMAFLITIAGAVLLIITSTIVASWLSFSLFETDKYAFHLKLGLAATALGFLINMQTLILRYEKRSTLFLVVIVGSVMINFLITYILLTRYNADILAPIYGVLFSNAICFLVLFFLQKHIFTINLRKSHIWMLLSFGIQSSFTGLLFYLLDWIDRLIIKDLLSLAEVGVYSLGYRIASVMNVLLITPFVLIWAPIRMEYAKHSNAMEFMSRVCSYLLLLGFALVLTSAAFGADFLAFFFRNREYDNAVFIFPLIMLAQLFFGVQNIVDFGIHISQKVYLYIIVAGIGIAFNVVMNYWLIPLFGYLAAAGVTVVTYLLTSTIIHLIANKYYKLKLEGARLLGPFVYLMGAMLFIFLSKKSNINANLFFVIRVAILLGFVVLVALKLTSDEKRKLRQLISFKK